MHEIIYQSEKCSWWRDIEIGKKDEMFYVIHSPHQSVHKTLEEAYKYLLDTLIEDNLYLVETIEKRL